ncbi:hypothetical protein [Mycolicibacterium fortuitum]|uniref:hypothetical protein n=1 Tax=Mycolicibacterium fortuitum TaxID=1766 RepID=UPI001CDD618A|nr:hypothetical protein [Mycolicibacterium fortuitum]
MYDVIEIVETYHWEIPAYKVDEFKAEIARANGKLARVGLDARFEITYTDFAKQVRRGGLTTNEGQVLIDGTPKPAPRDHVPVISALPQESAGARSVQHPVCGLGLAWFAQQGRNTAPHDGITTKTHGGKAVIPVFLDTETTGLHRGYRPWEIALIRREETIDTELTIFVDIDDIDLDSADPISLQLGGFEQRHPQRGGALGPDQVLMSGADAAAEVQKRTAGVEIWGVNPSYDTIGLDGLLARHRLEATWYYQPQDIAQQGRGFLRGSGIARPPRTSDELSLACGVQPPAPHERHTAMGDARWVGRWYDALGIGADLKQEA